MREAISMVVAAGGVIAGARRLGHAVVVAAGHSFAFLARRLGDDVAALV
jgi:hypothetical protein